MIIDESLIKWHPVYDFYGCSPDGNVYSRKYGKIEHKIPWINNGYQRIKVIQNGYEKSYLVHRLIYETLIGQIPKDLMIDHINQVKSDNRISNLRLVNKSTNNRNSSLIKGYFLERPYTYNCYRSQISVSQKKYSLGSYKTPTLARMVYVLFAYAIDPIGFSNLKQEFDTIKACSFIDGSEARQAFCTAYSGKVFLELYHAA